VWRTTRGERFLNYRATFTVLDVPQASRAWITQVLAGQPLGSECPAAWRAWVQTRRYDSLLASVQVSYIWPGGRLC
jgi:hypothetical protein